MLKNDEWGVHVRLSDDELRQLIAETTPDAVFDDSMPRTPREAPGSARVVVDRAALARKVAAQRLGLDSNANLPETETPGELDTERSKFIGQRMTNTEGMPTVKTAIVSTETGEWIAEQG